MEVIGSIYTEVSDNFQKGIIMGGISRCVKAEKHDLGVVLMNEVKVIGSLESKFESTNRIYDVGGCSPTLSTMQGGGQEPKILVNQLGFMDNGTGKHQSNTVYSENGLSPNITTIEGGGTQQIKICESQIVAMRGRNPDNPSDRAVGNPTEQRLEVNMQGTSNCLTSVQKDNLVMESQVLTPKRTEYGKQIQKAYESGQIQESRHNMTELEPRQDNVSNTLTTAQKDNLLLEKPQYRIRKLTPRECGRLMGVFDEDIDKMAAVNSNMQLYKQFGNSIVVDVMCAMFKNLNINQGDTV